MIMSEVAKQIVALPVVEKIENIETEVLPYRIQNINVPLTPEIIAGMPQQSTRKQIPIFPAAECHCSGPQKSTTFIVDIAVGADRA